MARVRKVAAFAVPFLVTPFAASEERQLEQHPAEDGQQREKHTMGQPVPAHPPLCVNCLKKRIPQEAGAIAKMPETCSKDGEDCTNSMRCCSASLTCYQKNEHWATCLPSCEQGIHFFSEWPWQWGPWSCQQLNFEIDKAASTYNSKRVIKPLLYSRKRHAYDAFMNQRTSSGYPLPEEVPRQGFSESAEACREKCDRDRRCDCVVYTNSTKRCEKRRACDASMLEGKKGTAVYVKVPEDGIQKQAYDRLDGTNLYNTEGKFVSEGKDVASGGRHPGDARYQDAEVSLHTCRRVCDLSEFCQCFVMSKATGRCETYLDCGSSRMISDSMYVVYKKAKPDAVEEDPDTGSGWWWLLGILLSVLLCVGLYILCVALCRLCAAWREKGCGCGEWLAGCGASLRATFCSCCDRGARIVPRSPGGKQYQLVRHKLTLGAVLENAASVKRWPGRCASCGCMCGRVPNWVPRTGAVVCTKDSEGGVPSYTQKLMPGDVLLQIVEQTVWNTDDIEQFLDLCDEGDKVKLRVLRPRKFGEYACSRDDDAAQPTHGQVSDVIKAAKPTHEEIQVQIVVVRA